MMSACGFAVLLFDPASPVVTIVRAPLPRFAAMGIAMGLTLMVDIYAPWGRLSGAHLNPAVTLTFYRLGKMARRDLLGYVVAQFTGGLLGTGVATLLFRPWIADAAVDYAVTVPGATGSGIAFLAELLISFVLMLAVLSASSRPRLARYTGVIAGLLVALYVTFETPISGMSMNPARTVGSAAFAHRWTALWLYFAAPLLGMLGAGELFRSSRASRARSCAKLHHDSRFRCIFCEHHSPRPGVWEGDPTR